MLTDFNDLTKHVYWDGRKRCYAALMAETPNCRAEGSSVAEALANVERAFARNAITGGVPAAFPGVAPAATPPGSATGRDPAGTRLAQPSHSLV